MPFTSCRQIHLSTAKEGGVPPSSSDMPYSQVSMEDLKDRLELSIRAEEYKVAADIRDEIK